MDIFPTIVDLLNLSEKVLLQPVDGISLKALIENKNVGKRKRAIPFRFRGKGALVDNDYKLVVTSIEKPLFELYDLKSDSTESHNIAGTNPKKFEQLKTDFLKWNETVEKSIKGLDYPEGKVNDGEPERHFWMDDERYDDFQKQHGNRPEYSGAYREMNKRK